jgi:hypothetical protein
MPGHARSLRLTNRKLLYQRIEDGLAGARVPGLESAEAGKARGGQFPADPVRVKRTDRVVPVAQRAGQLAVQIEVAAPPGGVGVAAGDQ